VGNSIRQIVKAGAHRSHSLFALGVRLELEGNNVSLPQRPFYSVAIASGRQQADRFGAYRHGADEDCRGCLFYRCCGRSGSKTKRTHVSVHFAGTGLLVPGVAGTCGRGTVVNTAMTF
jgi:hypothetical protein